MTAIGSERSNDEINLKYMWNLRLSHIGEERINKLEINVPLGLMTIKSYSVCESYLPEKMIKLSFVRYKERTTEILIIMHTCVWHI